ncbi:MAG: acyl-CoA/acyl-ACP dehydrogenase [Proteobacteria bacterium]|nr:acyl-CoA/acyl-ACP dehydrogenase [Pseudomonadota bacterium]
MNLDPSETQVLLRDTLRSFLANELPFDQVRACEKEGRADAELWGQLREHGWLATPFPSSLGGGGAGLVEAGLLVEELARRAAVVPIVEALSCGAALARCGGERGAELVRGLIEGAITPVPAVLESSDRFDAIAAEAAGDGSLRAEKYFVDYAGFATHHLVAARRGGETGLYLVDASHPAIKVEPHATIGRTPQAVVRYDAAPAERVAGEDGYDCLVQVARALCTVQIVASMQVSLDQTVAYTSVREQFGRPIGTFQAVQHHVANMATEVESVRLLAYEALDSLDRGSATAERIAIAKAAASRAVPEVTMLGHQLHGGQGYIEENDLYFFTLRGKDRSLAWGTADECLEIVAREIEKPTDWL